MMMMRVAVCVCVVLGVLVAALPPAVVLAVEDPSSNEPYMRVDNGEVHIWGNDVVLHSTDAGLDVSASGLADEISKLAVSVQEAQDLLADNTDDIVALSSALSVVNTTFSTSMSTLRTDTSMEVSTLSTMVSSELSRQLSMLSQDMTTSVSTKISTAVSSLRDEMHASVISLGTSLRTEDGVLRAAIDNATSLLATRLSTLEDDVDVVVETLTGNTLKQNELLALANDTIDLRKEIEAINDDHHKYEIAQATCTALNGNGGWVYAVERYCSTSSPSCSSICADEGLQSQDGQLNGYNLECFNSLHVYSRVNDEQSPEDASISSHRLTYKIYKYNSCGGGGCGPNFCCCRLA
ncbi:hypothetical protein PTSG_07661 [Salpingoeca rosetta]|uniref:Uncharacterized protein n=1 Tax=Salpingoeca rosetta (strain ATCC 50818 / BSB-021) TaxID=946362 RepID=F2UHE7_SALR5|nr:uncharacterized protein PTSG_07661 [Salpingoeca rosetta]EGD76546.1 hypothetical protein PTSG_07661 [Salpingoeca rosetta]|eukprot:XP_004991460.1 hypothetical protein PTSG_07661 [Salpingoeca rosetta]